MKKYLYVIALSVGTTLTTLAAYNYFTNEKNVVQVANAIEPTTNKRFAGLQLPNLNGTMQDFTTAAAKSTPGVVHIKNTMKPSQNARYYHDPFRDFFGDDMFRKYQQGPQEQKSSGSGVIITEDGYIVTNNHVIDNAKELEVTLWDNSTFKATLIGTDPSTDLAVIKIEKNGLAHLPFANSDDVQVGQWVLAVGNPFDLESTVTAGIVSAKGRNIDILSGNNKNPIESFIQTDAAVNPGNSGGALVNLDGALIGINTAIASPTGSYAGYAFAVPTNIVEKVVDDILKYGIVQRAFLGINIQEIDSKLAADKGIDKKGVFVAGVNENSGALSAGLQEGDVIMQVNGVNVNTRSQLMEQVAKYRPGNKISITYAREETIKTTEVVLRNIEGTTEVVKKESMNVLTKLGADFRDLKREELQKLNIKNGVEVNAIQDGVLKNNTGMREGFIIMQVNDVLIRNKEELKEVFNEAKGQIYIAGIYPDYPKLVYYRLEL